MVSISNVDLVMAALRSRLRRATSDKRPSKASASSSRRLGPSESRDRTKAIDAMRELPPDEFKRTLVRAVLESELGEDVSDDPRFGSLIERTLQILEDDSDLSKLLAQVQFDSGQGG